MTIFATILAILKAIPALKGWWDEFITWYIQKEIENIRKDQANAIQKAFADKDQRDIEKQLGGPRAGLPSGVPGTEIRDSLPGVPPSKPN